MRIVDVSTVVSDSRLTPDAVRIILYYATKAKAGPHAYNADELKELLEEGGPKRIAAALRRAERHGYLVRHHGGRGRTDAFTVQLTPAETDDVSNTPAETDDVSNTPAETDDVSRLTPAETDDVSAPRTRDVTREKTSSTPPTPRTRARKEDLDRLTAFLADHADAALLMDGSADHPKNWAAAVYGNFCREPSLDPILDRIPPPDKPGVVALALTRYAAEGGVYHGLHFRSYIERAARDRLNGAAEPSANGTENATVQDVPACTIEDVKALLERGGSDLRMLATRGLAFGDLERGYPDLWARAGPTFVRFQAFDRLLGLLNKGDDFGLNQAIRDQLRRLRRDRAA